MHQKRLGKEPDWTSLISLVDVNNDGKIDYEEFCTAAYDRDKILNDSNLELAFAILDKNSDGKISREELIEFLA